MSLDPIRYTSTRGDKECISFSQALLRGIALDGGLYVPTRLPRLNLHEADWVYLSYQDRCYRVLQPFMPEMGEGPLKAAIARAYRGNFESPQIAPVAKLKDNTFCLELYGGKTQAFKDMALSLLPHLMHLAQEVTGSPIKRRIVLTATSGDTGKAALEAFKDIPGIQVVVFYPTHGVSEMQKRQMATQEGANVFVYGIEGNFDDAQRAVKALMADPTLRSAMAKRDMAFAAANSVNIGRLLPQIAYYVSGYFDLVAAGHLALGESLNVVVPTGNFGNILAAYYAREMGLPIHQLILAANENNVLHDFVTTGHYNSNRPFYVTSSPSMDILVSSNLERLLWAVAKGDSKRVSQAMKALRDGGSFTFTLPEDLLFSQDATAAQVKSAIQKAYKEDGYVMDPHTAVAGHALQVYRDVVKDYRPALIVATASPFKFAQTVLEAIGSPAEIALALQGSGKEHLGALAKLWQKKAPAPLVEAWDLPIRHSKVLKNEAMIEAVQSIIEMEGHS